MTKQLSHFDLTAERRRPVLPCTADLHARSAHANAQTASTHNSVRTRSTSAVAAKTVCRTHLNPASCHRRSPKPLINQRQSVCSMSACVAACADVRAVKRRSGKRAATSAVALSVLLMLQLEAMQPDNCLPHCCCCSSDCIARNSRFTLGSVSVSVFVLSHTGGV